jgi:hypothetical protein
VGPVYSFFVPGPDGSDVLTVTKGIFPLVVTSVRDYIAPVNVAAAHPGVAFADQEAGA